MKDINGKDVKNTGGKIKDMEQLSEISFTPTGSNPIGYAQFKSIDSRFSNKLVSGAFYPILEIEGSYLKLPNVAPVHFTLLPVIKPTEGNESLFDDFKEGSDLIKSYEKNKRKRENKERNKIKRLEKESQIRKELAKEKNKQKEEKKLLRKENEDNEILEVLKNKKMGSWKEKIKRTFSRLKP